MCLTCHAPKTAVYSPLWAPEMQIVWLYPSALCRGACFCFSFSSWFVLLIIWPTFTFSRRTFFLPDAAQVLQIFRTWMEARNRSCWKSMFPKGLDGTLQRQIDVSVNCTCDQRTDVTTTRCFSSFFPPSSFHPTAKYLNLENKTTIVPSHIIIIIFLAVLGRTQRKVEHQGASFLYLLWICMYTPVRVALNLLFIKCLFYLSVSDVF